MHPQKKFVQAVADMEQALAETLQAFTKKKDVHPQELERILRLITQKEIVLSFLLEEVQNIYDSAEKTHKRTKQFDHATPIWIPRDGTRGPANPYPATIVVSGLKGVIKKVTVTLRHLYHTWPRDLAVLLVGPDGQNLIIMSLAGGGFPIENVQLTFSDDAQEMLPEFAQIVSGKYLPSNYSRITFPAPAPTPSVATELSIFKGINPNGVWQLYVQDVFTDDIGIMVGGWSLQITTIDERTGETYHKSFTATSQESQSMPLLSPDMVEKEIAPVDKQNDDKNGKADDTAKNDDFAYS